MDQCVSVRTKACVIPLTDTFCFFLNGFRYKSVWKMWLDGRYKTFIDIILLLFYSFEDQADKQILLPTFSIHSYNVFLALIFISFLIWFFHPARGFPEGLLTLKSPDCNNSISYSSFLRECPAHCSCFSFISCTISGFWYTTC